MEQIRNQQWLRDGRLKKLFGVMEKHGDEVRIAGGAVRNALWGLPVADIDAATTMLPDKVMSVCRQAGLTAHPTGLEHGTVTVVVDGLTVEVTTLRNDVETDGRRAVVSFTRDWAVDARRRDFTFNALYCDLDGRIYDETGQGLGDLNARRVRFVGDAETRIREDYLRILRYFRFEAQYGAGVLDAHVLATCERLKSGVRTLSVERIQAELFKLLVAPRVVPVIAMMRKRGILQACIDLDIADGVLEKMVALEERLGVAPDPIRRLFCLTGNGAALRLSKAERKRFENMKLCADIDVPGDLVKLRKCLYRLGVEAYQDQVLKGWVASNALVDDKNWQLAFRLAQNWQMPVFPLKGKDLLDQGIEPGQQMGQVLSELERLWIESDFRVDRQTLLLQADKLKF